MADAEVTPHPDDKALAERVVAALFPQPCNNAAVEELDAINRTTVLPLIAQYTGPLRERIAELQRTVDSDLHWRQVSHDAWAEKLEAARADLAEKCRHRTSGPCFCGCHVTEFARTEWGPPDPPASPGERHEFVAMRGNRKNSGACAVVTRNSAGEADGCLLPASAPVHAVAETHTYTGTAKLCYRVTGGVICNLPKDDPVHAVEPPAPETPSGKVGS